MNYLFYPQVILTLWGPLIVWVLARLTYSWRQTLATKYGFWLSMGLLLLPSFMWWVPYMPNFPLRDVLPYRVPIAWGVYNGSAEFSPLESLLLTIPAALAFMSMGFAALYGIFEEISVRWKVHRIPKVLLEGIYVLELPSEVAFTVGILKPRIYISRQQWEGPNCATILAHERAHVRQRHGLWLALARWSARSLWLWPTSHTLLREIKTWAELVADEYALHLVGKPALARALKTVVVQHSTQPILNFASSSMLTRRVQQLIHPGKVLTWKANAVLILVFLCLIVLI